MTRSDPSPRLAYVFWHRPSRRASREDYERVQDAFHARLERPSAWFRRERLPFGESGGYEDWYLVEGWADLGELNALAVDAHHRPSHDAAAALLGTGWGGVYALVRGDFEIPTEPRWLEKPRGEPTEEFLTGLPEPLVWRRQLVLGPAPEFCVAG